MDCEQLHVNPLGAQIRVARRVRCIFSVNYVTEIRHPPQQN